MKALTLRFSEEDGEALEAIAKAEGRSVNSLLREAVAALIQQRRQDPNFQQRLQASIRRNRKLLERLSQE